MKHQNYSVKKYPIRLGQFLKLAGFTQDGMEAKIAIQNGIVKVNGSIELRRGRKLNQNDNIEWNAETIINLT